MSKARKKVGNWLDFPEETGWYWRMLLRYDESGFHAVDVLAVLCVTEIVGDIALHKETVIARRPPADWREAMDNASQVPYGRPSTYFHPWRWLRIDPPELGKDEYGRISRKIVWGPLDR